MERDKGIIEIQKHVLEILKWIDYLCTRNGITYFIQGGTLLGAVREKGFIPWDDDGDITMYGEEYEKFLKCAKGELEKKGYFLKWTDRVPKVCLLGREEIHVDIFFIDPLPKAGWKRKGKRFLMKLLQGMMKRKVDYSTYDLKGKILVFLSSSMGRIMTTSFKLKLYRSLSAYGKHEHSGLAFFSNDFYQFLSLEFPESLFKDVERIPFEDGMLSAPVHREEYLRMIYGEDYMTPKRENYFVEKGQAME